MYLPLFPTLLVTFLLAAGIVFVTTPYLIARMREKNFLSPDMHKEDKRCLPTFGGVVIFLGFIVSALLATRLYAPHIQEELYFAGLLAIALVTILGLLDDFLDIPDLLKTVLPVFAALPLMVMKAGVTTMTIPFIGTVNLNFGTITLPFLGPFSLNLYVLLLIPIGIMACSNLINLLGGFNGLEVGTSSLVLLTLLCISAFLHVKGAGAEALLLSTALLGASIAFLWFNIVPAQLFPGNVATYLYGVAIFVIVVFANIERAGVICLMPQIIEFFLKLRSRFQAENFGKLENGRLTYDGPIYSLTHLCMKYARPTEGQLVLMLMSFQLLWCIIALISVMG